MLEEDPLARGRSRTERGPGGSRIVIPAEREWPILLFLLLWIGTWTAGGVDIISDLVAGRIEAEARVFTVFWLGGWALGWAFVASVLTWGFLGKEIVQVEAGTLVVTRAAGRTSASSGSRASGSATSGPNPTRG